MQTDHRRMIYLIENAAASRDKELAEGRGQIVTSVLPKGPTEDTVARLCSHTSILSKKFKKN